MLSTATPTNSPTPTVAWQPPSDPPTAWREGTVASGVICVNVSVTGPEGGCGPAVCVAPGTNQWTLPAACHTAQGDGTYAFSLEAVDAAGNISAPTYYTVNIDTVGPSVGNGISVGVDPRTPTGRSYTVSGENTLNPATNSNLPVLTITCAAGASPSVNCQPARIDQDPPLIWITPTGTHIDFSCNNNIILGQLHMTCEYTDSQTLQIGFESNPQGHNGNLQIDLSQVFKDLAGNPATGNLDFDINNLPPVIVIGEGQ